MQQSYDFSDRFGRFFERNGLPRMAGRVMGHLLIASSAEQTFDQLTEAMGASRSTVSVATQWLVRLGFVERFSVPDERRDRYRISSEAWTTVLTQDIQAAAELRALAEAGLNALASGKPVSRQQPASRLQEMKDFYAFLEASLTPLLAQWQKLQATRTRSKR